MKMKKQTKTRNQFDHLLSDGCNVRFIALSPPIFIHSHTPQKGNEQPLCTKSISHVQLERWRNTWTMKYAVIRNTSDIKKKSMARSLRRTPNPAEWGHVLKAKVRGCERGLCFGHCQQTAGYGWGVDLNLGEQMAGTLWTIKTLRTWKTGKQEPRGTHFVFQAGDFRQPRARRMDGWIKAEWSPLILCQRMGR